MKSLMKKTAIVFVVTLICFSSVLLIGCEKGEFTASFVRFSIGERTNDYYLDFTIRFENSTTQAKLIESGDFYVEINGEEKAVGSFLYEYQDTFYAHPIVEAGETLTLRVRVISQVNMGERNPIVLKYKDTTLVDDNVYFNKNN